MLTVAFRLILAIPPIIVLTLLGIALFVVGVIAFFAVLFTGRWPDGLRDFVLGFGRSWRRVQAYLVLLTDESPRSRCPEADASVAAGGAEPGVDRRCRDGWRRSTQRAPILT